MLSVDAHKMSNNRLVVIDDNRVFQLINDKRFISQFPDFLNDINNSKIPDNSSVFNGCRPCQKRSKQAHIDSMVVKRRMATMTGDDLKKIKEYLNADTVRLIFKTNDGRMTDIVI
jgi:hypothetical protein